MRINQRIAPCLWFENQAEQAAAFYVSIFPNSRVTSTTRYSDAGHEIHGRPPGSVMTVTFDLDGQMFTALNGGPLFRFNEAISLQVFCENQQEIDRYWIQLTAGGDPNAQQCGWLKDKYGLSWQVVPKTLANMFSDPNASSSKRAMTAMLGMKKLDMAALQQAYDGGAEGAAGPRAG